VRVIIEKWDYIEYGYKFRVMQWKRVNPLAKLVSYLLMCLSDLEGGVIECKNIITMYCDNDSHLGYLVFTIRKT